MNKLNNINSKQDHILACLSSAPSNAKIIRTAARMAKAFDSQFTALFVETPDFAVATDENKKRLEENRKLAEQLGATIETVYGDDIPYQIAEFARISGITRIVLGQSSVTQKHLFGKPTLTQLLLSYVPELDIHIIPDKAADTTYHPKKARKYHHEQIVKNTVKSALILFAATLLSLLFHEIGFTDANIIMVYILGVLLTSIATSHQIYSLISSIASVFIFNYLFTVPRFSLAAYDTGYPVTFVVMFLTAYITGTFAIRYKEQARQSEKIAKRTKILFDTDQLLSKAENKLAILQTAGQQINKLLGRSIVIFDHEGGRLSEPIRFISDGQRFYDEETELAIAEWVLQNNHNAGATTKNFPDAQYLYLAVRVNERIYGVVGIDAMAGALDASEQGILLSILGETALAIQNVFEFDDLTAREIAVHRTDVTMLWVEDSMEEWNKTIHNSRHTLYPVCGNSADNIIGILNAKDYFRLDDKGRECVMQNAVKAPFFVPETIKADVLFRKMKKSRNIMAIVLDEYGGVEGIVTLNDLIEQLVGDLGEDTAKEAAAEPHVEQMDENIWAIIGNVELYDIERALGVDIGMEDVDTFSGLVFGELDMIPNDGEQNIELDFKGLHIHITHIENHQISNALISKLILSEPDTE